MPSCLNLCTRHVQIFETWLATRFSRLHKSVKKEKFVILSEGNTIPLWKKFLAIYPPNNLKPLMVFIYFYFIFLFLSFQKIDIYLLYFFFSHLFYFILFIRFNHFICQLATLSARLMTPSQREQWVEKSKEYRTPHSSSWQSIVTEEACIDMDCDDINRNHPNIFLQPSRLLCSGNTSIGHYYISKHEGTLFFWICWLFVNMTVRQFQTSPLRR